MAFPVLGLKFDLAELAAGIMQLGRGKAAIVDVGRAADATTKDIKEMSGAQKAAGDQAAASAGKTKSAAQTTARAQREQSREVKEAIRQLNYLTLVTRALQKEQALQAKMSALQAAHDRQAAAEARRLAQARAQQAAATRQSAEAAKKLSQAQGDLFGWTKRLLGGFGGLFDIIGKVRVGLLNARFAIALLLGGFAIGPIVQMMDAMTALESRVALYAKTQAEVPTILAEVYETAQRARAPLEGVAKLYTRLAPLSDQLGKSQKELLRVVETVSKAFAIGGASAAEATSSAQQFAQAISSNRFGGDELRSVAENAPVLLQAIAEGINQLNPKLNLNAATFIKWAQAGNASSEVMIKALEMARSKIDAMFSTMPVTISQAMTVLKNAFAKAIGEIDAGFGAQNGGIKLSQEIANAIMGVVRILESPDFVQGAVDALTLVADTLQMVGRAIEFVANGAPVLAAALATWYVAAKLAPIIEALAFSLTVYGARLTLVTNLQAAATAAAVGLRAAWTALVAASPLIILAAVAAAVMYVVDAFKKGEEAVENYKGAMQGLGSALDNAIMRAKAYGQDTTKLTAILERSVGIQREQNDTTDEGTRLAQARAEMEKKMAIAQLASTSAQLRGIEADARKSASIKRLFAAIIEGMAKIASIPVAGQMLLGFLIGGPTLGAQLGASPLTNGTALGSLADALEADAARLEKTANDAAAGAEAAQAAIGLIEKMDFTAGAISDAGGGGGGGWKPGDDKDGKHGTDGALKRIAKLRASMLAMEREVAARVVGPFGKGGTDELAAYAAGLEALANYGATSLDKIKDATKRKLAAQEMDLAMQEALKKLETDRIGGLVDQTRQADMATAAANAQAEAMRKSAQIMADFYKGGDQGSKAYERALQAQIKAEEDAKVQIAKLAIANSLGAKTWEELPPNVQKYAQTLLTATEAQIRAEGATSRLNDALTAMEGYQAQIADLKAYNDALEAGTLALVSYNREQAIKNMMAQNKGMTQTQAAFVVDSTTVQNARRVTLEMGEQNRLAAMSADAREVEKRAMEIMAATLAAEGKSMEDLSAAERQRLITNARITAQLEQQKSYADQMKGNIKDKIKDAFIETGKLDFTPLAEGVGRAVRKKVYEALIEKPVDLIVNAVVDVTMKGLDAILAKLAGSNGKGGDIFESISNIFKPGGAGGDFLSKFGQAGTALSGAVSGMASVMPYVALAQQANIAIGKMLGFDAKQQKATEWFGVLGGLLVGKESNHSAAAIFNSSGTGFNVVGPKMTSETNAAATQVGTAMVGIIGSLKKVGIDARNIISGIDIGSRDPTHIRTKDGRDIRSAMGDPRAAVEAATKLLLQEGAYDNPQMKKVVDGLLANNTSMEDILKKLDEFVQAQQAIKDVRLEILKYTDPREYTLQSLRNAQLDRRQQFKDYESSGFYTPQQLTEIETLLGQLELEETRDALNKLAESADSAAASMAQIKDAQAKIAAYVQGLLTGNLSPLSPSAQLQISQDAFFAMLTAAQGGNRNALENITGSATDYLSAAQSYFGSGTRYAEIFEQVTAALEMLSTQEFQDPIIAALEEQMDLLRDAIEEGFGSVVDAINGTTPVATEDTGTGGAPLLTGGGDGLSGAVIDALNDLLTQAQDNNRLTASLAEAVLQTNEAGFGRVAETMGDAAKLQAALNGGQVRKVA